MNDQQPQYDCSKSCFYIGPTTTGPRVSFPHVPAPALKGRVPRTDCVIYRDKPLPREAFWRTAEQAPTVWLRPRTAPPEKVWVSVTPAPCPPFPLPPKSTPSTWVLVAKVLVLGALLLCFLPRKATEPAQDQAQLEPKAAPAPYVFSNDDPELVRIGPPAPAPRAQLVNLPPRLIMPDRSMVKVSYRGELANETLLPKPVPPMAPNRLGDTFLIQRHLWVCTTRIGSTVPAWIDP